MRVRVLLLIVPACILLLAGCHVARTDLRTEEIRGTALYRQLFDDSCTISGPFAPSIAVYRTRFEEKFVEAGSVLSIASMNSGSKRPAATYKYLLGYRQDLYLVRVSTPCHPDAWVYFSVVYRPDTKSPELLQEGFGKAYLGEANPGNGTIYFSRALSFGRDATQGYYLRKRAATEFFFVTDGLAEGQGSVDVARIVIEEKNKFAGPNPFVFVVSERFGGELERLAFKRVGA